MDAAAPNRRWFYPTPGWLVLGSLVATGVLYLAERFRWLAFNQHKGWTVLIAVAGVVAVLSVMFVWCLAALIFRWRFQFSIRSLLVLAVAAALPLSWFADAMSKAKKQTKAVDAIRKGKGWVLYGWEFDANGPGLPNAVPHGPARLRSVLGDDFFNDVVHANLTNAHVTDSDVEQIAKLSELQMLNLDDNPITDESLRYVKGLRRLQTLSLHHTNITDGGLKQIAGLTTLEILILDETAVTDIGLEPIEGFARLRDLWLADTKITDSGLKHLQGLNRLEGLTLTGTQITDAGLIHLQGLNRLQELKLTGTKITDAGLVYLKPLSKLKSLYLIGTPVTKTAADTLRQSLPTCQILGEGWFLPPRKQQ